MAVCGDCSLVESVGVEAGMAVCGDEFLAGCRQPPHPRMFGNFLRPKYTSKIRGPLFQLLFKMVVNRNVLRMRVFIVLLVQGFAVQNGIVDSRLRSNIVR